jgi:hypothetical protein
MDTMEQRLTISFRFRLELVYKDDECYVHEFLTKVLLSGAP